jgi:hypothetical protein
MDVAVRFKLDREQTGADAVDRRFDAADPKAKTARRVQPAQGSNRRAARSEVAEAGAGVSEGLASIAPSTRVRTLRLPLRVAEVATRRAVVKTCPPNQRGCA